jgi:hypothetical protein
MMYIAYHIIWPSNACGLIVWSILCLVFKRSISKAVYLMVNLILGPHFYEYLCGPDQRMSSQPAKASHMFRCTGKNESQVQQCLEIAHNLTSPQQSSTCTNRRVCKYVPKLCDLHVFTVVSTQLIDAPITAIS